MSASGSKPLPVPPGGDQDRSALLLGVAWAEAALALSMVAMRIASRSKMSRGFWWDDAFIVLTMLFVLVFSSLLPVYAAAGGARHEYYLTPEQLSTATELNWICNLFILTPLATGKISVCFLLQRLLYPAHRVKHWILVFVQVTVAGLLFGVYGAVTGECHPISVLWTHKGGWCDPPTPIHDYGFFVSCYFAFMDFALALFPLTFIWQLHISLAKKISLCALLGLGLFAGACAVVKTTYQTALASTDFTWSTTEFLLWNSTEANAIIIAACVPTIQPITKVIFEKVKTYRLSKYASSFSLRRGERTADLPPQKSLPSSNDSGSSIGRPELPSNHIDKRLDVEVSYSMNGQSNSWGKNGMRSMV